jgi:diaminohydroxyphosphoribosylaminopyrimidine deaminase/5-amino-6-(5-phosphoribosylamino)uracil reductase
MNEHIQYLQLALDQAKIRRGFCAPNPAVGAVVVKNKQIVAMGLHAGPGQAHAEIDALNKIDEVTARGATLYVTLEPCCHWGKTPPCTHNIIKRGIQTVVYGFQDPNPIVAGRGHADLINAGITCIHLPLITINEFYQSYTFWTHHKLPWVTAKLAQSLDGKIAGPDNQSIAITGPALQKITHQQRKQADALLTTAKTILYDNPQMNVRLADAVHSKPVYVLDSQLNTPTAARIFHTANKVTLFHQLEISPDKIAKFTTLAQVKCVGVTSQNNRLNLSEVLAHIGADGIHDLWIEAGGHCLQSFLEKKRVHRLLLYVSPKYLGPEAISAFNTKLDFSQLATHMHWEVHENELVGDLLLSTDLF